MKKYLVLLAAIACNAATFAQTTASLPQAVTQKFQADEKLLADWPQLGYYQKQNAGVAPRKQGETRVVFMGDSITDLWGHSADVFFPGKPYINRGIGGQTTSQMLLRFRQDVIDLHPRVVVLLGGVNDLATTPEPAALTTIEGNLSSMAELARANGIKVVMSSLTPVSNFLIPTQTTAHPPQKILELNEWIKSYARKQHFIYADYYSALLDANHSMKRSLSFDGLHPNAAGYAVMTPLAQRAIDQALAQ
ncbi:lysophospholipase L1-like esterase [Rhodanobacter sp. ANJX3]|jgi:lysophospholipase L1-like esterase|uniref:SGNH/GDSL hydrolase family protein n=1 Tax=unclassified Rhodanobacter TaxID=2621553 RepID=UPI0015C7E0EC|nr:MULTISPECIES: SGNH/GDSL hydrolase family protein [unclassified Rhodanobacter]MBB5358020.1 lysophospholipase L1-like esterase [Rhodanobacter sp. ANJX3]NYE29713.1 lysophospholipase L1-like esterase [Rhodanobacter sp. K2T2]